MAKAGNLRVGEANSQVEIRTLTVDGQPFTPVPGEKLRLPARPKNVVFALGPAGSAVRQPLRFRYTLDGADERWHERPGEVRFSLRFFDAASDQVAESLFRAFGQSEGWTGKPETSAFVHHREEVDVPARAKSFWLVMTSAGPPTTIGAYVITNMVVYVTHAGALSPEVLVRWAFDAQASRAQPDGEPEDWIRDGLRPSMAKILGLGGDPAAKAFAIVDDDVSGHAEWHIRKERLPAISPGDRLTIVWDEAYSVGDVGPMEASYQRLPAGDYRFRVNPVTLMGTPAAMEAWLTVEIPSPFWETTWFWALGVTLAIAVWAGSWRFVVRRRIHAELLRLEHLRVLERERLRIAQDIHDDLGARVTQISLLSAMAQRKPTLPDEARAEFGVVSQMTRDLVAALYETVWAVNPENDNLEALANYLCQVANQMCAAAQLRCRLDMGEWPASTALSSQVRHNLVMAAKEAIHNAIKHAQATEIRVRLALESSQLSISVADNGCGFDAATVPARNGLANMRRRMESLGGSFTLLSRPGHGAEVLLKMPMPGIHLGAS